MSGSQKVIKVFSIIAIVGGILMALLGVLMFAGVGTFASQSITVDDEVMSAGAAAVFIGVLALISAIEYIVVGCLGVRGANNPAKITPFYVVCWIVVVLQVLSFASELANGMAVGQAVGSLIGGLIIPVILLVLANKVRNQAK